MEKRQCAERERRCSASDCFLEGRENMEVAREDSAGDGGVVMVFRVQGGSETMNWEIRAMLGLRSCSSLVV